MDLPSTWLSTRDLRDNTRRAYEQEVERWMAFMRSKRLTWPRLCAAHVNHFRAQLESGVLHALGSQPSEGSMRQCRRIVSAFVRWVVAEERAAPAVLAGLDQWREDAPASEGKTSFPRLTTHDFEPSTRGGGSRDKLAVALSYWTGATPAELAQLKTSAISTTGQVTFARYGRRDTVRVPRELAAAIVRVAAPERFVFGGTSPPSPATMALRIRRYLEAQSPGGPRTARELRAAFIARARSAGWNLEEIRVQLRRPHLVAPPVPAPPSERLSALSKLKHRPQAR